MVQVGGESVNSSARARLGARAVAMVAWFTASDSDAERVRFVDEKGAKPLRRCIPASRRRCRPRAPGDPSMGTELGNYFFCDGCWSPTVTSMYTGSIHRRGAHLKDLKNEGKSDSGAGRRRTKVEKRAPLLPREGAARRVGENGGVAA